MKKYYTLAIKENNVWTPEFGDYDLDCVKSELEAYVDDYRSFKRKDLKIVTSKGDGIAVVVAIRKLNQNQE